MAVDDYIRSRLSPALAGLFHAPGRNESHPRVVLQPDVGHGLFQGGPGAVIAIPGYPPRVFPGPLMELKNRFEDLEAVLYSQIWPDRTVADGHHETVEP